MNARKTGRRRLEKLSAAAEAILLKRTVLARFRLVRCLKILKELARFDEAGDLLRASNQRRGIISGVVFFVLLFVFIFLGTQDDMSAISAAFGAGVLIAGGLVVYSVIRYRRLKSLDLANDFRTVLVPFLTAIREDVSPHDRVKLKLDLAGPTDSKVIRKGEPTSAGGKKFQDTVYSDPWCHLEVPLITGSRITLDISNLYTCRKVTWKNPGGKHKRKTKWKKLVRVRAGMSSAPGRSAIDPGASDRKWENYVLRIKKRPEGETAAIKMKRKFKSTGSASSESVQPKEVLSMFLRLQSLMRPVKTGSLNA